MSRVIIKQLPKNITEDKIRALFGSRGTITDLQLKYTPDGKFRQFGFIGYRNENDAQEAVKFFNNTCIQTSRIKVELCAALGAVDSKAQRRIKNAEDNKVKDGEANDTTRNKSKKNDNSKIDDIIGEHKNDPNFQEFLKVHDRKRTLWANDAGIADAREANSGIQEDGVNETEENAGLKHEADENENVDDGHTEVITEKNTKLADKKISDLDYMKSLMASGAKSDSKNKKPQINDLYTIKIYDVPYNTKRQDILKFFKPLKPYSVRLPAKVHGFCYVGFKNEKDMTKAMLKNKSFINGKQVFFADFTERNKVTKAKKQDEEIDDDNATTTNGKQINAKWSKQLKEAALGESIAESGCIFFRNLAYTVTEDDLQKVFEPYGPVAEIHLPVDKITRQIKGFGTVTFVMPEHAVQAFNKLDGSNFHGRLLHLIPAKGTDGKGEREVDVNDVGLSYKQKKAKQLQQNAQQPNSWNTLFLGANAVADLMAQQYETSKEHILDTSQGGSSAAVRIALGETHIVMEMKRFLEEQGVCLTAFDTAPAMTKRSKQVMLVKNLPSGTTVADLTSTFCKYGPLARLVLPPSGVTAIVEYCSVTEAQKAFKHLAYSKFKHVPLFLEWAPENVFTTAPNGEAIIPQAEEIKAEPLSVPAENVKAEVEVNTKSEQDDDAEDDDDIDSQLPEPQTTLFLHNLNFETVERTVREHFKHLGAIHTVEIAKRKDPENPRQTYSLGYGFIQFKLASTADKALKQMQCTVIDEKTVELKRSDRILKSAQTAEVQRKTTKSKHKPSTKILIRNIPFQAKHHELRDIFKAFGELRSLRLPLKATPGESTHRGFGFVDFITKSDAKKAFVALGHSTHLYGRRLVLEWAASDDVTEDVDEIRKRTAQSFEGTAAAAKRSKKGFFNVDLHMETANANATTDEHDDDI